MKKRVLAAVLSGFMAVGTMACGNITPTAEETATTEEDNTGTDTQKETMTETASDTVVISDVAATLRAYGPGLFTAVGENGTVDMITGTEKPGYNKLLERWNELYPNVKVEIEAVPWDNWKAAVQTAALSGDYDIIIHGNGNADYCLDLTDYIDGDPEVKENVTFYPFRRNPSNFTEVKAYGISYSLNPIVCIIDKQIFEDYGVEIPSSDWTYEDLANLAERLTGIDPMTGEETFGVSMCKASDMYKNYKVVSLGMDDVIFDFSEKLTETKVTIDNPKTVEVFNYIKKLSEYSGPDYLEGLNLTNSWTEKNNIAMTWSDGVFDIYNTIKANGLEDRFMFLALPKVQEGEDAGRTSSVLQDLNMAIYKDSNQKDLAWAFLKFMLTDPVANQWLMDTYSIPANIKYAPSAMPAEYSDAISEVIDSNPYGFDSSASSYYDSTWFGTLQSDIVAGADELLRGNKTADEVVKTLQSNVDTYLGTIR